MMNKGTREIVRESVVDGMLGFVQIRFVKFPDQAVPLKMIAITLNLCAVVFLFQRIPISMKEKSRGSPLDFKAPDYSAKNSALTVATQNQTTIWRNGSHTYEARAHVRVLACAKSERDSYQAAYIQDTAGFVQSLSRSEYDSGRWMSDGSDTIPRTALQQDNAVRGTHPVPSAYPYVIALAKQNPCKLRFLKDEELKFSADSNQGFLYNTSNHNLVNMDTVQEQFCSNSEESYNQKNICNIDGEINRNNYSCTPISVQMDILAEVERNLIIMREEDTLKQSF
ncbi:hypothetical protein G5I_06145 [Acromyrmex echinatior]|uniref:Uncharacterized protein n=1 Tax=Acromyrmex echinatior TaxID=103372 RepID=F4WK93_ACREC|nr:hypothetical protein G5I_06145 [Acromyrmex echinatior]